ncbi:hypothetical protein ASE12_13150 [Aeromicrobium sp. Root236]|uniref:hypothetical protein n=1 Tax=Aeromicrobium sp. Root236 TaxID=1736498 RepID=UPI0006FDD4B9|nr:hypothetical protein [Aeromicrobium sp. Root236]KRC65617.1 hypothetical protein ASE12_13150 [Aeromicrobium sp. Root236]
MTTWLLTMTAFTLYVLLLDLSSMSEVLGAYLVVGLFGLGMSMVAVLVHSVVPHLATTVVVTIAAGFVAGYGWGLLTYGSGAEDGTIWRGLGGALIGAVAAVAAWVVLRSMHGLVSRGVCRPVPSAVAP